MLENSTKSAIFLINACQQFFLLEGLNFYRQKIIICYLVLVRYHEHDEWGSDLWEILDEWMRNH